MEQAYEWDPQALLQSPPFSPLHPALERFAGRQFPTLQDWNKLLETWPAIRVHRGHSLRFVPQEQGKPGFESQYEPRCYLSGEVQTRENNWHDLFNALVWLTFPGAKAAINMRHYQALKNVHDGHSQRGRVRDMATLLDESGVIIVCANAELAGLLREFKWKELFWQRRAQLQGAMDFYVFGHGLYEKAVQPYIGMTGQGLVVMVEAEFFNWPLRDRLVWLDQRVAEYLLDPGHCTTTRELHPVPLLGVPGWSAENLHEAYYDNTAYFRPGRAGAV
jgi:hypothetical protein